MNKVVCEWEDVEREMSIPEDIDERNQKLEWAYWELQNICYDSRQQLRTKQLTLKIARLYYGEDIREVW